MDSRRPVRPTRVLVATALAVALTSALLPAPALAAPNPAPPATTAKYVFVHHSTGDAWLQDGYGTLASALGGNNYFVSDTNYGWGPDSIGDSTDIGHWWTWFRGPSAATYTAALYANTGINSSYARSIANPGGENSVVMIKSCFPNSAVGGSTSDPIPAIGANPLRGNSGPLTVGNAKGIYLDLLEYFRTRPDKLFVLIVSPPLRSVDTNASEAANARHLANWLVDPNGYLNGYATGNVFVYDYFTVLTGGHHRVVGGTVEHTTGATNYLQFPTGDSHPSAAGDQLATSEFVPMLNAAYNAWKAGGAVVPSTRRVYRFFNKINGSHFYTASESERDDVLANLSAIYTLDGPAYCVTPACTRPLFRFYNRTNGSHFYTASQAERDTVFETLSATYSYDGIAYGVSTAAGAGLTPVWRFYNVRNGSHFYTASTLEKDTVIAELSATYALDGVAFFVAP